MAESTTYSAESLHCPKCGRMLRVKRLVVEDEEGHDEVVCLECPSSDFHRAVTAKQVVEITTRLLAARVQQELRQP